MNDKDLADAVVALGIKPIKPDHFHGEPMPELGGVHRAVLTPEKFVRDWRVAGALLERLVYEELLDVLGDRPAITIDDNVEPRVLIELAVEHLTVENPNP